MPGAVNTYQPPFEFPANERPAARAISSDGLVDPNARLLVLVAGGPSTACSELRRMAREPGLVALEFVAIGDVDRALEGIGKGTFDAVVVFGEEPAGQTILRVARAGRRCPPVICMHHSVVADERREVRARTRRDGAAACIFVPELTPSLFEAAILHSIESKGVGAARRSPRLGTTPMPKPEFMVSVDGAVRRAQGGWVQLVHIDCGQLEDLEQLDLAAAAEVRGLLEERLVCAAAGHPVGGVGPFSYAVAVEGRSDRPDTRATLDRLLAVGAESFSIGNEPVYLGLRFGVARARPAEAAERLMGRAAARATSS